MNVAPALHAAVSGAAASVKNRRFPRRIAILNDHVRIPYANGSSFASQMLYREFARRGHEVTVVGPADPAVRRSELPRRHILFPSLPVANHPGVFVPMPEPDALAEVERAGFDFVLAQTGTALADLGVWLRRRAGVPFVCVNTVHLPSLYTAALPEALYSNRVLTSALEESVIPWLERRAAAAYNQGDGLVVLSRGLARYWRERGVTVPIWVIPRSVEPKIFDVEPERDPFPGSFSRGHRLLVVCRHTREKALERLLRIFAARIAPASPEATLTLVGDGPDHELFRRMAEDLRVAHRTHFPGETPLANMPAWYRHADLFVYTSLSETYGQVVGEAQWCGLATVAFADDKGVSEQVENGENGYLVRPGPDETVADERFAAAVIALLEGGERRRAFARRARERCRTLRHPDRGIEAYYDVFDEAREHAVLTARAPNGFAEWQTLTSWRALHLMVYGAGRLRAPARMDLSRLRAPSWDGLCVELAERLLPT